MQRMAVLVVLTLAVSGRAQSLGDVVRADRERPKPRAAKVVTNDNLNGDVDAKEDGNSGSLAAELAYMRKVLRGICSDPRTDHGTKLADEDKQAINDGVTPLRARMDDFERIQKKYKDALAALDEKLEADIFRVAKTGGPLTERDIQRMKSVRADYDTRRAALMMNAKAELKDYETLQKELESVGSECPEAAKTVPN
jgi:hypothetical protein